MTSLVHERDRRKVIWPSYFDSRLSRDAGRRARKSYCIEKPDIERLSLVLKSMNLKFEVEKDKKHPARWWENEGRIRVETNMPKSKLIEAIAIRLRK